MKINDLKDISITDRVHQVLMLSMEEARGLGSYVAYSEHILLGLLNLKDGTAAHCLQSEKITKDAVLALLPEGKPLSFTAKIELSNDLADLFKNAGRESREQNLEYVGAEQLLLALLFEKSGQIQEIFKKLNIDIFNLRSRIINREGAMAEPPSTREMQDILSEFNDAPPNAPDGKVAESPFAEEAEDDEDGDNFDDEEELPPEVGMLLGVDKAGAAHLAKKKQEAIQQFTQDLTVMATKGKLDPVIGRKSETHRVLQVLSRRTKNNALLLGEAGVGKTAIVEGIAQAIASNQVPERLKGKKVVSLDITGLVAGTKYRGQFEERIKKLLNELAKDKNTVLFIDEIHTMLHAGNAENALDLANVLKPALARGELQCIGATTPKEFHATIEKDSALERRFQPIQVNQPSKQETLDILEGIVPKYQEHHNVTYSKEILQSAIDLSERYLPKRKLPDKVIDIIDEAGAAVRLKNTNNDTIAVTPEDVSQVVAEMAGLPVGQIHEKETTWLLNLEQEFSKHVIGQSHVISAVCRALRRSRAELKAPGRPIGSFLFLGSSGVGKTLMARTLAQIFFHSSEALIQLDMSEFSEALGVSRLVGSTPGYIGYEEGGQLTEKIKRQPSSVVLFDELEKAHPEVINLLLQILEEGKLTDGSGTTVNFANTIIILTSNAGTSQLDGKALGFNGTQASGPRPEDILRLAKKSFRPELLDRLDECIVFNQLTPEDFKQIVQLEIKQVADRLQAKGGTLSLAPEVLDKLLEQKDEQQRSARTLRRNVQRLIEDTLADQLIITRPAAPFTASCKLSNEGTITIEIISTEKKNVVN